MKSQSHDHRFTMNTREFDINELRKEAQETYREYGRVRELHRRDRSDQDLRQKLHQLRVRYAELKECLEQASNGNVPPNSALPSITDIKIGEPSYHAPPVQQESGLSTVASGLWTGAKIIRPALAIVFLLSLGLLIALIATDTLGFYVVPSSSMEPTLVPEDRLVAYADRQYDRGDVVVLRDPNNQSEFLVKRIVAKGGDTVAVNRSRLILNGSPVTENYLDGPTKYHMPPITVAKGHVFVLGDNRNYSEDGHVWKTGVPVENIMGRVRYIYAPKRRKGSVAEAASVFQNP